ncbi:RNA polymerase sigma factor [Candidatus Poriferisodalis sp.]|uniref:RNA polymerase sigma factor n=1 Tax=Candidatus Poriferisodalis sp. TaxID=3101277 RepID=UPI003D0F9D2F
MTAMMAVRMLGAHDQDWFRGVYAETYRPLLAYARRRVDRATADEVVAETFLTAWRRRDDVPDGSERLWLFGVARNVVRNASRSNRRRRAAQDRLRIVAPAESVDPVAFETDERAALLRTALAALPVSDREILMLVAWEELSHAEIAQTLDISANAVAIRIHRARKRLSAGIDQLAAGDAVVKELRPLGHTDGKRADQHQPDEQRPDSDLDDSSRRAQ